MAFQATPTTIPLIISTVILLTVTFMAYGRRHVPGARSFIWLMLSVTEWTVSYALQTASVDPQMQIFWAKCQFIGVVMVPMALLAFSLEYSHRFAWVTRRNLLLLGIIPACIILLVWTNEFHHLFWSSTNLRVDPTGVKYVDFPPGPAFWVHAAYSYTVLLIASVLLVIQSLKAPSIFESQTLVMLLGAAMPLLVNIVYIFFFVQVARLDPTPFAMMISGVFYAWGLFRLGLFNLLPVAGEVVLEGMQEGVMILDEDNRVVYINPAFSEYSGVSGKDAIGTSAREALARWPELVNEFRDTSQAGAQINVQLIGDTTRRFEMRISPLRDRSKRFIGRAFILRETATPVGSREVDLTSPTARRNLMLMTARANGEVLAVNDRFAGVLGYNREEITERSSIGIWESMEQRSDLLRRCHSEGFENMQINLIAKDRHKVSLVCSAKPITVNTETYLFFAMREKN